METISVPGEDEFTLPHPSVVNEPLSLPQTSDRASRGGQTMAQPDLMFIENVGQFSAAARFMVRGNKGNLYLANDALWFTIVAYPSVEISESLDIKRPNLEYVNGLHASESPRTVNLSLDFAV